MIVKTINFSNRMFSKIRNYLDICLSAVVLVLTSAVTFLFCSDLKFDGRTFFITAEKLIAGKFLSIYDGIIGSGPFTYQPQASVFLLVMYKLGFTSFLLLLIFSATLIFYLATKITAEVLRENKSLVFLLFYSFVSFWFVIYESIYIGQIDLILCFLLLFAFWLYFKNYLKVASFILGVIFCFKPQFLLFAVPVVFIYGASPLFFVGVSVFGAITAFCLYTGASLDEFFYLFKGFLTNSKLISDSAIGPVNQSMRSIFTMLFADGEYHGRFCPLPYAPQQLDYKLFVLPMYWVSVLLNITRLLFFSYAIRTFYLARINRDLWNAYIVTSLLLPTLSPVFWQVHVIYLIPPTLIVLSKVFYSRSKLFYPMLGLLLISFLISPLLIGGCLHDQVCSHGYWLVFSIAVLGINSFCKKTYSH